jgi:hypothetical protein
VYGGEKVLLDLTRGLRERGHHVFVACPSKGPLPDILEAEGVNVFIIPMRKTYDFAAIYRLYRILRKYKIDVIHSHGLLVNILSRVASYLADTPVSISTAHLPLNLKSGKQAQNIFEKLMIPYYLILDTLTSLCNDKIIAVSHAVKRDLMEQGVDSKRIVVEREGGIAKQARLSNDRDHYEIISSKGHSDIFEDGGFRNQGFSKNSVHHCG